MQVVGQSIIDAALGPVAARAWNPAVAEWVRRSGARHVRREGALLRRAGPKADVAGIAARDGLSAAVAERIARSHASGSDVFVPAPVPLARFAAEMADVVDWLTSLDDADRVARRPDRRLRRIERLSVPDALAMSAEWHGRLAREAVEVAASADGTREAMAFEDGSRVVELVTPAALKREGSVMGHCVGGYWDRVSAGACRIFSLRDADGGSHVTIEIGRHAEVLVEGRGVVPLARMPSPGVSRIPVALGDGVARQAKGKGNRFPAERWVAPTARFLAANGWSGEVHEGDEAIEVFSIAGRHFADPDEALVHASRHLRSGARRDRSIRRQLPQGTQSIAASATSDGQRRYGKGLLSAAARRDAGRLVRRPLLTLGSEAIDFVVHPLPLGSMELVAAGMLSGESDAVAVTRIREGIALFLDAVEAEPGVVHAFDVPGGCGLTPANVSDMFLLVGLADRRARAASANGSGLDKSVRRLRDALRIAIRDHRKAGNGTRVEAERIKYLSNVLAGDALPRIGRMVSATGGGIVLFDFAARIEVPKQALAGGSTAILDGATYRALMAAGRRR